MELSKLLRRLVYLINLFQLWINYGQFTKLINNCAFVRDFALVNNIISGQHTTIYYFGSQYMYFPVQETLLAKFGLVLMDTSDVPLVNRISKMGQTTSNKDKEDTNWSDWNGRSIRYSFIVFIVHVFNTSRVK